MSVQAQSTDKMFSHQIAQGLFDKTIKSSSSAAYRYTEIGEYHQGLQLTEVALSWGMDTNYVSPSQLEIVPPEEYFKEISDEEKIVIVSEAHQKPQHRIFTRRILKTLYDKGFRYFGLEALTPYSEHPLFLLDSTLNERGYPLDSPLTGRYAMEPQMGNLIREALKLGFTVFGYERSTGENERDLQQALNIKKIMDQFPEGKFLIHCGWYHAIESDEIKRRKDHYLAYHIKELTGIDPLTIYQDFLSEKVLYKESPTYIGLKEEHMGIVIDKNKKKPYRFTEHFDINIYHPRTRYINSRPSWLFNTAGYKEVSIPIGETTLGFPMIIEAILAEEAVIAAPVDRVELQDKYQNKVLALPPGNYIILMRDHIGKEVSLNLKVD